jgi:hypothetical protein
VYLLVFHTYINEMHGSRSKIPSKKSRPYIHDVKFLALLGPAYMCDISRLRVNKKILICILNFRSVEMQGQDCCAGSETVLVYQLCVVCRHELPSKATLVSGYSATRWMLSIPLGYHL